MDIEDHNEVYYIHQAVTQLEERGAFICTKKITSKGKMYFLKCSNTDEALMLASEKARDSFLVHLRVTYAEGMDIESWHGLKDVMEKND